HLRRRREGALRGGGRAGARRGCGRKDRRRRARAHRREAAQARVRCVPRRRRHLDAGSRMNGVTLFVALIAFGVLTGVASGLLGVGGGTLMVPFLTLAAGFSQHAAEATSLLVVLPTAIAGSLALRRRGVGDLGLALRFGLV